MPTAKAKRRGSSAWRKVRDRAFRRDKAAGAPCWICGQPIDYEARRSSTDDSWEGDHYLPVSRHPEYEYDIANVRPAHRKCNRSRHDKAGVDELGVRSRDW